MGTLTALGVVQEFCGLRGLPIPTALVGSTEKSVAQYRAVLSSAVRHLLQYRWEQQKIRLTFTAVATADQGLLTTLFPGFESLVPDTGWAMTRKIPVTGPIPDTEWAVQNALSLVGPPYKFWLGEGKMWITPTPVAGESYSFIYRTLYGYANGTVPQETLTADTNTLLFPDDVVLKEFEWNWKKQKGENWQDDYNFAIGLIAKEKSKDGLPNLSLDRTIGNVQPRIYVPVGNWQV